MANQIKATTFIDQEAIISLTGEINSNTAPDVDKEISEALAGKTLSSIVLDIEDVTYLSSAGLRVILKLKQTYGKVSVINASLDVYDVLSMTGFTNILEVRKALRKIDVTGCEIVGEGYFSNVYRLDRDTIVKAYKRDMDMKDVERELALAKEAFVLGIPTAISFDVVKVEDKLGVVFEMLNSTLLRDLFRDEPARFDELIQKYAKLLKTINTTETLDENLPKTKDKWLRRVEKIKDIIPADIYEKTKKMISGIPEANTFVHGDCHIKNILMQENNEPFLIDMDTLSRGNPIFELSSLCFAYILFEENQPGNNIEFFGIEPSLTQRIYRETLKVYLGKEDEDIFKKIHVLASLQILGWHVKYRPEEKEHIASLRDNFVKDIQGLNDFDIGL